MLELGKFSLLHEEVGKLASLDGSSAIVCRRLHMALLSYYFHHGSSRFDAMCGAFAHEELERKPL